MCGRIRSQCRTARPRPEALRTDTTPLAMALRALSPVEMQLVRRTAEVFGVDAGKPVWPGVRRRSTWQAATDSFGWSGEARRRNIRFIAYESHLPILS